MIIIIIIMVITTAFKDTKDNRKKNIQNTHLVLFLENFNYNT